jgi:hypothetical protein
MVDDGGRTVFRNLYHFSQPFRDHNWSDFFADLRQAKEESIEYQLREEEHGPEPYFYSILPVTLRPETCEAFLRSTDLPVSAQDYYLSKLFQFLYVPLKERFPLADREELIQPLEEYLDSIPSEYIERLGEFDWPQFYDDSQKCDLDEVLRRVPQYLPITKPNRPSKRMTLERWVAEKWPSLIKRVRGTDTQKEAAGKFGVSVEAYKKWEEGKRPPAARNMAAVHRVITRAASEE